MKLERIVIKNFRSIASDDTDLESYTFFIGRNNIGKSNYLKAVDILLSQDKTFKNFAELALNKNQVIEITGYFRGCEPYLTKLKESKHQVAVNAVVKEGLLALHVVIGVDGKAERSLLNQDTNELVNPTGLSTNLFKLFPETIFVRATADTSDELGEKQSTALSKIKKEVLDSFFQIVGAKVKERMKDIDSYLHGENTIRAAELRDFEKDFDAEMMGEFETCKSRVEFDLPDQETVKGGMRILLKDAHHSSEIADKGHGLQRTAFFAMVRMLAQRVVSSAAKPPPIFLIEELEAFLHPSAQVRLVGAIKSLTKNYQVIVTTHSPFVVTPEVITGLRMVRRNLQGSQAYGPTKKENEIKSAEYKTVRNGLAYSGQMAAIFSDRIVVVEGKNDDGFFPKVSSLLGYGSKGIMVTYAKASGGGATNVRQSKRFFELLGAKGVSVILDYDCLFASQFKEILKDLNLNPSIVDELRSSISWSDGKNPSLGQVLTLKTEASHAKALPIIIKLASLRVYILQKGGPENYFSEQFKTSNSNVCQDSKRLWEHCDSMDDLADLDELNAIFSTLHSDT